MAENKEKVTQYFSNVVVRTMRKDIEALKKSGGLISYTPEPMAQPNQAAGIKQPDIEIVVPDLGPQTQPQTVIQQPAGIPGQAIPSQTTSKPPEKNKQSSLGLTLALVGTVLILGGSVAYWVFLKPNQETPSPSPTVVASETPSPSPVKQNPTVSLKNSSKTSLITIDATPFVDALKNHLQQAEFFATTTLATIELAGSDQEYITSDAFIALISPDSLKSFRATLGPSYAMVVSVPDGTKQYLGAVLEIRTDGMITAQTIMKNWETANIKDYFKPLIQHHSDNTQTDQKFTAETVLQHQFRTTQLLGSSQGLVFSYGFIDNYLVISTHATLTKAIIQGLK